MYTVDSRGQARSAHIRWSPDHHYPHTWPSSCYRSGHSPEPYFVSRGRSYRVKLGTRVTFHCEVSTLSDVSIRGHWYIIRCHSELVTDKLAAWSLVTLDAPGRIGNDMMRPQTTADCTMGNQDIRLTKNKQFRGDFGPSWSGWKGSSHLEKHIALYEGSCES